MPFKEPIEKANLLKNPIKVETVSVPEDAEYASKYGNEDASGVVIFTASRGEIYPSLYEVVGLENLRTSQVH